MNHHWAARCRAAAGAAVAFGCSDPHIVLPSTQDDGLSATCAKMTSNVPRTLDCTGLYADFAKKKLASRVRPYTPALPLWSDGLEKHRWIYLPEDTKIDTSKAGAWVFPIGTKFWKEFSNGERRIETRLFHKVRSDRWERTTYVWNDDETEANQFFGGEVTVGTKSYYIPDGTECDDCHKGSPDRILGFEAVSLGLRGAKGETVESLIDDDLVTKNPRTDDLDIPDDGTGASVAALKWLHVNCGASCHNGHPNSTAYSTGLRLRLDPNAVMNDPPEDWDPLRTTINVKTQVVGIGGGATRIIPGQPEASLVYSLTVVAPGQDGRMPPIATRIIDEEGVAAVQRWILRLGGRDGTEGSPDASPDEPSEDRDASPPEAPIEAAAPEAAPDAYTEEAGPADTGATRSESGAPTSDSGSDAADAGARDAGDSSADAADAIPSTEAQP